VKILLTNDDGIEARGLRELCFFLRGKVECLIVAPREEHSAMAHSISLRREIWVEKFRVGEGLEGFAVDGTPADCVKFAACELAKGKLDLIISGINVGLNTGVSVYYSGTVSAAREGLINGIPAVAISQGRERPDDFSAALALTGRLLHAYGRSAIPRDVFLNVNVPPIPASEIRGIRITKQARSRFAEWFECRDGQAAGGKVPYQIRGDLEVLEADGRSDEEALRQGFISVTPLQLDLTHYDRMADLESWAEKGFRDEGEK